MFFFPREPDLRVIVIPDEKDMLELVLILLELQNEQIDC